MWPMFLVAGGGVCGALARWSLLRWEGFPAMPLAVGGLNMLGSFLVGVLLARGPSSEALLFLGTGFLGAFTTFSTFSADNLMLMRAGSMTPLLLNLFVQPVLGLALAWLGNTLGSVIR